VKEKGTNENFTASQKFKFVFRSLAERYAVNLIRFSKIKILHPQKYSIFYGLWASIGKHPTTHASMAHQNSLQ